MYFPAWLIIMEKLAAPLIEKRVKGLLCVQQYGFKDESDCSLARLMVYYTAKVKKYKKAILSDVAKAYDSVIRAKMKEELEAGLQDEAHLINMFLDIY
jgi:hypothetical protein